MTLELATQWDRALEQSNLFYLSFHNNRLFFTVLGAFVHFLSWDYNANTHGSIHIKINTLTIFTDAERVVC